MLSSLGALVREYPLFIFGTLETTYICAGLKLERNFRMQTTILNSLSSLGPTKSQLTKNQFAPCVQAQNGTWCDLDIEEDEKDDDFDEEDFDDDFDDDFEDEEDDGYGDFDDTKDPVQSNKEKPEENLDNAFKN
jgi:hypothetical protein